MHAGTGDGIGSMKNQFKKADLSGAQFALIFGPDELALRQVSVKSLRDGGGAQRTESIDQLDVWAKSLQSTP
jgi:histidyl-tRNA synthetase